MPSSGYHAPGDAYACCQYRRRAADTAQIKPPCFYRRIRIRFTARYQHDRLLAPPWDVQQIDIRVQPGLRWWGLMIVMDNLPGFSPDLRNRHFGMVLIYRGRSSPISIRLQLLAGDIATYDNGARQRQAASEYTGYCDTRRSFIGRLRSTFYRVAFAPA